MSEPPHQVEEEIFETEDFPEIRNEPPAVEQKNVVKRDGVLDTEDISPERAFEVFMGKKFDTRGMDVSDGISSAQNFRNRVEYEVCVGGEIESPLQRFTRLQAELNDFEKELSLLAKQQQGKEEVLVDAGYQAEFEEMSTGLSKLQLQIKEMSTKSEYKNLLNPTTDVDQSLALQKKLTADLIKQVKERASTQQPDPQHTSANMKYELYYMKDTGDYTEQQRLVSLDNRIGTMEKMLGNVPELGNTPMSTMTDGENVIDCLNRLEDRVNLLSEKKLDAIATRVRSLLHEFQLLNKQQEKSNASKLYSNQEEAEKIASMYKKLEDLDDYATVLPAVVERMRSLKLVHEDAAQFSKALSDLEASKEEIQTMLRADRSMLEKLEENMESNLSVFQKNIEALDARIDKLLA